MKSATRPHCAFCGKPARKQTRIVWVRKPNPLITHNDSDTRFSRHIYLDTPPRSMAECARLTNWQVTAVSYSTYPAEWGRHIDKFHEWDGESYSLNYGLFCGIPCAEGFAVVAHRAGYRIKGRAAA
jgi:hypothetical protein